MENLIAKFDVCHNEMEIGYKRFKSYEHGDIASGCVDGCNSYDTEYIAQFDTLEEAEEYLNGKFSSHWEAEGQLGKLIFAEEYWVEENFYTMDEDGELEFDNGSNIHYIAPERKEEEE